jgi:hypothetical protein
MVLFNTSVNTNCMVSMSDYTSQPLTRAAMQAQAEAIAARQAAEAGLPSPTFQETPVVAEPLVVAPPVVVPPIVVPVVKTAPVEQPVVEPVAEEPAPSIAEVEKSIANVELDEEGNPLFNVSSALIGESTGTNLIVELPLDITAGGALITDSGELVVTGSIDVSALITTTGEIDISAFTDGTDTDLDQDAQQNFIPGIPPIRISGVITKTLNQPGIPGGAHRGINPYWYVAMISAAALLIAGGIAISISSGLFN